LNGVACTSAAVCTAVGNQTPVKTLAERWNGRRWQVQATPNPGGGQEIFFAAVDCPARTVCTAFGLNLTGSGPLTLAERWSGGRWRIQPTPGLAAYDIGFPRVACPTPSACYAFANSTHTRPRHHPGRLGHPGGAGPPAHSRPAGGARRPPPRLHPRRHAGLTSHQRPDPSHGMVPIPSRQLP